MADDTGITMDGLENFLTSQKESFASYLKGCKHLDRKRMRAALAAHRHKMEFVLVTAYPIEGNSSVSAFLNYPQTPSRATRQTAPSLLKSPAAALDYARRPSVFKRTKSDSSATPANTPTSKNAGDLESGKSSRVTSVRRGTVGGASRLFRTPHKGYTADDSDSSAGSAASSEPYKPSTRIKIKTKKANASKAPLSPFEIAARAAEINHTSKARKQDIVKSSSSSDIEITIPKSTVRKVGSAKIKGMDMGEEKKGLGEMMDIDQSIAVEKEVEGEEMWEAGEETPSKKQKVSIRFH